MNGYNNILADCISAFHILIILFVLIAPFSQIPYILGLHVTLCITLIVHWIYNNDTCALSIMESKLRGVDYTQSFSHKFVSPLYNISETKWSRIIWTITIIAMIVSGYKLYHSEKIKRALECYKSTNNILECVRVIMN